MIRRSIGLLIAAVLFAVNGCSEDPTSIGSSLVPSTDTPVIRIDTVYAMRDSSRFTFLNNANTERVFLGLSPSYEAWAMVNFTYPSIAPDSTKGTILGAWIQISSDYVLESAALPVAYDVFPLNYYSYTDSLTLDSLTTNVYNYYNASAPPIGRLTSTVVGAKDSVRIPLTDLAAVRRAVDGVSLGTPVAGFLLKPTLSGSMRGFVGISLTSASTPRLVVQYSSATAEVTYHAEISRSVAVAKPGAYGSFAKTSFVQSGVSQRVSFDFDFSKLTKASSVYQANLELNLNAAASSAIGAGTVDSLIAYFVDETGAIQENFFSPVAPRVSKTGRTTYVISLAPFVQQWMRPEVTIRRVVIAGFGEKATFDRYGIYDSRAANVSGTDLRPRIVLSHSPVF